MARGDRLEAADRLERGVVRLLIGVARIGDRALGQHAARVGRGVHHRDPLRLREIQHRLGVAIDEREAIMGHHCVEVPIAQQRHHHVDLAGGDADRFGETLLLEAEKFAERAVAAGGLGERARMLEIVQIEQIDALDPQRLQTCLERAARLRGVEDAGVRVAVDLGGEDEAGGQAAALAQRRAKRSSLRPSPRCAPSR